MFDGVLVTFGSALFAGAPSYYGAYLLTRKLGWRQGEARVFLLALVVSALLGAGLMYWLGNDGLVAAFAATVCFFFGVWYGGQRNADSYRRRQRASGKYSK